MYTRRVIALVLSVYVLLAACVQPDRGKAENGPDTAPVVKPPEVKKTSKLTETEKSHVLKNFLLCDVVVSLNLENATLKQAADTFSAQVDHEVKITVDPDTKINLKIKSIPALAALHFICVQGNLTFALRGETIILLKEKDLKPHEKAIVDETPGLISGASLRQNKIIFQKISTSFAPFVFHDKPFSDAIEYFWKQTGVNLVVDDNSRLREKNVRIHALKAKCDYALYWLVMPLRARFEILGGCLFVTDRTSLLTPDGRHAFRQLQKEMHPENQKNPYVVSLENKLKERRGGLKFKNVSLEKAIWSLADRFRINTVIDPALPDKKIKQKINLTPGRLKLHETYRMLLGSRKLGYMSQGGFFYVTSQK